MITICGLRFAFEGDHKFRLGPIDVALPPAALGAVIGANGAGKSTFLKVLAGHMGAFQGAVSITDETGKTVSGADALRRIRPLYLDQDAARDLVPSMTLAENMFVGQIASLTGTLRSAWRREALQRAQNALATVGLGLESRPSQQARALSGGERQGLVLARALSMESRLLLLDEFVSAIAHVAAVKLLGHVRQQVKAKGLHGLFVTHQIEYAIVFSDYVLFMDHGELKRVLRPPYDGMGTELADLYKSAIDEGLRDEWCHSAG